MSLKSGLRVVKVHYNCYITDEADSLKLWVPYVAGENLTQEDQNLLEFRDFTASRFSTIATCDRQTDRKPIAALCWLYMYLCCVSM